VAYFDYMSWGVDGWLDEFCLATLLTLCISLCAMALGSLFGAIGVAMSQSRRKVVASLARGYVVVFRALPDLLVIYLLYFGANVALTHVMGWFGSTEVIAVPAFVSAALAIGLTSGAYQAEVLRGAFDVLDRSELEATLALGLSRWSRMRCIIIPQVLRHALPGLGNTWQLVLKESALVAVVGLTVHLPESVWLGLIEMSEVRFSDLLRQAQVAAGATREPFVFFLTAALFYLALTASSAAFQARLQRSLLRGWRSAA
jgi:octopine/nopaline transport system permease protein